MRQIKTEIAVVGGGPAGVCAALTAARGGARTALIHNRPVMGGNSSSEIRVWTRGATGAGNLFAEEMGVWGDLKMRNLYTNSDGNPVLWDDVLLDLCLAEPNLELFLNTKVYDLEMTGEKVAAVFGQSIIGEDTFRFTADVFIDCTGDGALGAAAGVPFHLGKEAQSEYGESLAGEESDPTTQGCSLLFNIKKTDHKVDFVPPKYAYDVEYIASLIDHGGRIVGEDYGGSDYWWFEYGGNLPNAMERMQDISLELKKLSMGVWNYIKNSGKFSADSHTLEWVGNYPGKRESRRMMTDYVLRQSDLEHPHAFYDGSFYGGWFIDFHPADGMKTVGESCTQIPVNLYEVPLRCLYNSTVPNLIFAGRNIGTSHVAFASTRIMNTCAQSGQAAGELALWCAASGGDTSKVDITAAEEIRRRLIRRDQFLPQPELADPENLARFAKATATSNFDGACGDAVGMLPLNREYFLTFPGIAGQSEVEALLCSHGTQTLRGTWHFSDLPSRYLPGEALGKAEFSVPAGNSWVKLNFPPLEKDGFVTLVCEEDSAVSLCTEENQRTGFLCGRQGKSDYAYPCVRGDYGALYTSGMVNNGQSRPWGGPNLWMSGAEQSPAVMLTWEKPQTVRQVTLDFNPDLCKEIPSSRAAKWTESHNFTARTGMPPELVKGFTIETLGSDGQWQIRCREEANWRRHYEFGLDTPVETKALRITVTASYGSPHAQIFEIRAYS